MLKKTLLSLFILLSSNGFAALPKGIGAWLYAQDSSWVTQLNYYNTQVAGKTDGANRQIKYLFPYAGSVNINAGGTGSFSYSTAPGIYYKAAFPSSLIMPNLDNSSGANMAGWSLAQKQTLADNIAAAVNADSNADGIQVDIEPYTAAYHDAFYQELKLKLSLAGKYLTIFTGATGGNLYSSTYNDIVVFSGYDLGGVTNPTNYGSTLNTRVTTALANANAGGTKMLIGVPAAAGAEEYQYSDGGGACNINTGFTQEQWFASALNILCAKHFNTAYLGASLWGYFYQVHLGSCYHHPESISYQNIDGLLNINPPTCSGPFIPTASITPTWSPTSLVPPTIIDDFSSAAQYTTTQNNDLGQFTDDDSTMTSDLPTGGYLALAGKANGYWYSSLGDCYNASGHDGISFDVRGVAGGETFNVILIEKSGGSCGSGNNNKISHSIPVTNYITVTTSFQTVIIPFSHFGVSPTNLYSFSLDGLALGQTIHIDNLQFATISGSPTPTATATPQINGAWPLISNFNGDAIGNSAGGSNSVGNDNDDACGPPSGSAAGFSRQSAGGHDGSGYLRLTYTVAVNAACGYQYASFAMPLPFEHDISAMGSLRLWVRGGVGGEVFKVKVKSTNDGCVPGKNSMYIAVSATAGWTQISLPFSSFVSQIGGCPYLPGNNVNVDGVDILVDTISAGTLDFDDIEFVAAPPTATPTPTASYTNSPSPTISATFSFSPTDSPTAPGTFTETPSFTASFTNTDSPSPTISPTPLNNTWVISAAFPAFSPNSLTITAGDTVHWQNLIGHNVAQTASAVTTVYDGSGFRSGAPSAVSTFDFQFNTVGTYFYICEVHGAAFGMRGVIFVIPFGTPTTTPTITLTPTTTFSNTPPATASPTRTHTAILTPSPSFTASPVATVAATLVPGVTPGILAVPNPASPSVSTPMLFVFANPENLNGENTRCELYSVGYTKVAQLSCQVCHGPRLVFSWAGDSASGGAAGTGYYYAVFNAGDGARKVATKFVIIP